MLFLSSMTSSPSSSSTVFSVSPDFSGLSSYLSQKKNSNNQVHNLTAEIDMFPTVSDCLQVMFYFSFPREILPLCKQPATLQCVASFLMWLNHSLLWLNVVLNILQKSCFPEKDTTNDHLEEEGGGGAVGWWKRNTLFDMPRTGSRSATLDWYKPQEVYKYKPPPVIGPINCLPL